MLDTRHNKLFINVISTYLFFNDQPLICYVNYGSVHCLNLNIWGLPYYSNGHLKMDINLYFRSAK